MVEMEAPRGSGMGDYPLWVRALAVAVPLTVIEGVFLGLTGYPVEEWPFVAGLFTVSLLCCGFLLNCFLILVSKGLYLYGRGALANRAVGSGAADAEVAVPRGVLLGFLGCYVLLTGGVVWGLALSLLLFLLRLMDLPSPGGGLRVVSAVMFLLGGGGIAATLLLVLAFFCSVHRFERQWVLAFAVARLVLDATPGWQRAAAQWVRREMPRPAGVD